MLTDIGLTRTDLHQAMAQPRWHDPTALLAIVGVNAVKAAAEQFFGSQVRSPVPQRIVSRRRYRRASHETAVLTW